MSDDTNTKYITLDDLNYFWMPNGAPCFIANNYDVVDDFCETVESFGFQIYYIITDKESSKTVQAKNDKGVMVPTEIYQYAPAIFKVVNNFTGRAVMESKEAFGNSFCPVKEAAEYNMPAIPRVIIDKLDEFFRLVHAQHGTESIVILTFDTTKEGSDGWGVLVPQQENTSVHCKYDADSIAEMKPDNLMIVGSVHSHPEMSAYASGTDHADQADFDGVHITYGWQKSVNGGATQYHIELQIGGENYKLNPEDVFEYYSHSKDPDPEVVEWSSKVKKVLPPSTGVSGIPAERTVQAPNQSYQTTWAQTHNSPATTAGTGTASTIKSFDKSKFINDLQAVEADAIVAFEHDERLNPNSDCLICDFPLNEKDINSGFCMTCDSPIISPEMGHFEIMTMLHMYCVDRKLDPTVAYYVYCLDDSNSMNNFLLNIKPKGVNPSEAGSDYGDTDSSYVSLIDEPNLETSYTLCCNLPISMMESCACKSLVLESDIRIFDDAHKNSDIYSKDTKCYDCQNYYSPTCPAFRQAVVDYMTDDIRHTTLISDCESFIHYKESSDVYTYEGGTYYYD
jgi:hypothetical protein